MSADRVLRVGLAALLASLPLLAGCQGDEQQPPAEPPWEHPVVGAEATPGEAPPDLGGGPLPPPTRGVRRMTIDMLQASMSRVAGADIHGNPILWRFSGKDGFSDGAFGKALGRPDFQSTTEEGTVANALYLKFVGDAARDICTQMAENDLARTGAASRALFPAAPPDATATDAQISENLRYLVLRFLGLRVAAEDPMLPKLRAVYDAGVASAPVPSSGALTPQAEGWRGVCVALFESPLFHND